MTYPQYVMKYYWHIKSHSGGKTRLHAC